MKWKTIIFLGVCIMILTSCQTELPPSIIINKIQTNGSTTNMTDTNETARVDAITNSTCPDGQYFNGSFANGTLKCGAPSGSGDITSVQSTGLIYNGSASGDINLATNWTLLYSNIDTRTNNKTYTYQNITNIPNCSSDEQYLTMVDGVLSCDPDDTGSGGDGWWALTGEMENQSNKLGVNDTWIKSVIQFNTSISFLNVTPNTYTGNITNGSLNGYIAAHAICNATFTGTRLCSMSDISNFLAYNSISNIAGNDTWATQGGAKYVPAAIPVDDCLGFTSASSTTHIGNYFHFNNATSVGDPRAIPCNTALKLSCCK